MKTMTELISFFQLEYPDHVAHMKECNHHLTNLDDDDVPKTVLLPGAEYHPSNLNPFHIESDVFTHTMMVCKQAEKAPYEVRIAALLHDIGKPSTRKVNPKNGRVSFFNHDAVSAFMALEIMNREELGLSKSMKTRIFNMIALHTQVYKLTPEQLVAMKDPLLLMGLIALGKADHAGRFHTKGEAVIPDFKDLPFVPYEDEPTAKKEVTILCGLPASGKSTYIKELEDSHSIVSRDECLMTLASQKFQAKEFTYNEAWEKVDQKEVDKLLQLRFNNAKKYSDLGLNTIIDMTHMSKKSRRKSLSHFGSDYYKKCVVFLPDMPTLLLRNEKRCGKIIGRDVIEKMMRSFYPPTYEEFDEIEYII